MIRRTVPQVERKDFFSDYGKTVSFIAEVPSVSRLFLAGLAVYEASDLTVGNHTITASYSGDSHYKDSTNSWLQNVNKICSQISMNILQSTMVGLGRCTSRYTRHVIPTQSYSIQRLENYLLI
ncbi:Ig-like domain-containing protein [Paenibacillus sp. FSL R5-0345]|uniref:Ig-like domain-containing protein n=1 Tax=Paenibacillus sp. FSL R5-0345 TaxID=1536770 RepID=UPI0009DE2AC5